MEQLVGILGIFIIFGGIILVHEFGHFIVARWSGMAVYEFSLGMGPLLFSHTRGGTQFSIRAIPFGGFVRIAGMEMEEIESGKQVPNGFDTKPFLAKFGTIIAGVLMNFLLAAIVFSLIGMAIGTPLPGDKVYISGVQPNLPAAQAGLQAGDQVLEINGVKHPKSEELSAHIRNDQPPVRLVVLRDDQPKHFTITPTDVPTAKRDPWLYTTATYRGIGISITTSSGGWQRLNPVLSVVNGFAVTGRLIDDALAQFVSLVTGRIHPKLLSGPIGIMKVSYDAGREAIGSRMGLHNFFSMLGLISIFVGFFNLLPIPALDGSRLVFLVIEAVSRKPIDKKKEAVVHTVGLVVLLSLILVISVKDVFQFFVR